MNQSPVFVTGFSRGGTTILMNLLASHPHLCTVGETHQLFKGSNVLDSPLTIATKAVTRDLPILLSTGQDFLSPRNWKPRPQVHPRTQAFIHRILEQSKTNSSHDHLNRYKSPSEEYSAEEIAASRLLAKNLDGAVFLTDVLREIYPDARFVGLTRNGLALCEGHTRRGRSAEQAGVLFNAVAGKMMQDAEEIENYQLLKFEDLLADPVNQLRRLFVQLDLNPFLITDIRQQERKMIAKDGKHRLRQGTEWDVHWIPIDSLPQHLDGDVNQRQIARLAEQDKAAFLKVAGTCMNELGYGNLDERHQRMAA